MNKQMIAENQIAFAHCNQIAQLRLEAIQAIRQELRGAASVAVANEAIERIVAEMFIREFNAVEASQKSVRVVRCQEGQQAA